MANTDSFIDEVTEEVRQDRLYGYARKYGWIVVLAILVIVGGTAFFEYRNSQATAKAQARGDAILLALDADDPDAALDALAAQDPSVVVRLLSANTADDSAALRALAADSDQPAHVKDLALLRLASFEGAAPADERIEILTELAAPGGLYQVPAREQLVMAHLEAGNQDAAVAVMNGLLDSLGPNLEGVLSLTALERKQALRFRELMTALGVTAELANDTAPVSQD